MGDFFKVYGPIVLLVALGFLAAYQFVDPAPPREITLATGSESGAYHAYGLRYRDILARDGIEVKLVATAGSVENLDLLASDEGGGPSGSGDTRVDLAFVQSGIGTPAGFPNLVALASLYYEPLWVFTRASEAPGRLNALAGRRLAVGAEGSGTRFVALQLLAANGIGQDGDGTKIEALGGSEAIAALQTGLVDAAFLVTAQGNRLLSELLEQQGIGLMSFERAEAYARRFPHLSAVSLPEGVLDLANNIPAMEMTLVSPVATLVSREDLHPALIDLVMRAAQEIHAGQGLFEAAGRCRGRDLVSRERSRPRHRRCADRAAQPFRPSAGLLACRCRPDSNSLSAAADRAPSERSGALLKQISRPAGEAALPLRPRPFLHALRGEQSQGFADGDQVR